MRIAPDHGPLPVTSSALPCSSVSGGLAGLKWSASLLEMSLHEHCACNMTACHLPRMPQKPGFIGHKTDFRKVVTTLSRACDRHHRFNRQRFCSKHREFIALSCTEMDDACHTTQAWLLQWIVLRPTANGDRATEQAGMTAPASGIRAVLARAPPSCGDAELRDFTYPDMKHRRHACVG